MAKNELGHYLQLGSKVSVKMCAPVVAAAYFLKMFTFGGDGDVTAEVLVVKLTAGAH